MVFWPKTFWIMPNAYLFDAVRSPRGRGKAGGALHEVKPVNLFLQMLEALSRRNGFPKQALEDVVLGCATPIGEQGGNIAKTTLHYGRWDWQIAGLQINRFCASGLEAVSFAAARVAAGWADLLVAGGVESMSRVPMGSDGSPLLYDPGVTQKALYLPQGISADLMATMYDFSREDLDVYALRSHQLAAQAQAKAYGAASLIPILDVNGLCLLDQDEAPHAASTSLEALAALPPAFADLGALGFDAMALLRYPQLEGLQHLHTAGNSARIVDGAGAVLLGSETAAQRYELKPRAKLRSVVSVGCEPTLMLGGGSLATQKALQKAQVQATDIDLWEYNEAFAAPALHFQQTWKIPNERYNVNGGAIALGHPIGATGALLISVLLDELERRDLNLGALVMPVAGGMATAAVIERV